jgi:uncharacterized membrane protein
MISTDHIHPMLVHFPIALVTLGFVAELASLIIKKEVCFPKIGFYLLMAGTLSAVITWLSGLFFTGEMSGSAGEIRDTHEMFAWITIGLLLVTSVLKVIIQIQKDENPGLKWVSFVLYALAMVSVSITGFFGGTLVYNYLMQL